MKRFDLIAAEGSKEELIRDSYVKQTVRNAAIALAIIFGSLVLYFCLVPALAEGDTRHIYFDNGLSMYEKVEYSINGTNYEDMLKLSENLDLMPTDKKNINPEYVWVTPREITGGKIWFRGTASGKVYDTTSNYQISSASREWGYEYNNFTWTTEEGLKVDHSQWNCYYAAALGMQYKYNAQKIEDGKLVTEYFITPEPWARKAGIRTQKSDTAVAFLTAAYLSDEYKEDSKDLPSGNYFREFNVTTGGITFTGKFAGGDVLRDSSKTIDNISFTKHIETSGGSNGDVREIYFSTQSRGTVKFYAGIHNNENNNKTVSLYKKDNNGGYTFVESKDCQGNNEVSKPVEFTLTEPGEYRVSSGRMYFYGIKVEYAVPGTVTNALNIEKAPMVIPVPETEPNEAVTEDIPFESENPMEGAIGSVDELTPEEEQTADADVLPEEASPDTEEAAPEEEQLPEEAIAEEEIAPEETAVEEPVAETDIAPYADNGGIMVMANEASGGTLKAKLDPAEVFQKFGSPSNGVTLTSDSKIDDYFTIMNGTKIESNCIKFSSSGDDTKNSIQITVSQSGYLRVNAQAGGTSNERKLWLYGINSTKTEATTTTRQDYKIIFDSAGTYYLASTNSGINIYSIELYYDAIKGSTVYFTDADRVLDIDSLSDSGQGTHNEIFTISNEGCWVNDINSQWGSGTSVDGKDFTANINLQNAGTTSISSIKVTPEKKGKVVIYTSKNGEKGEELRILDSGGQIKKTEKINGYSAEKKEYTFDTIDVFYIASNGDVRIYAVAVYYDNGITYGPEVQVYPDKYTDRIFKDYKFAMEGKTGMVTDNNDIGNDSQGENIEGSYAVGNDPTHGLKDAYEKAFRDAKATFYDYYSDWELTGKKLSTDRYFYENEKSSNTVKSYNLINYKASDSKNPESEGQTIRDKSDLIPGKAPNEAFGGFVPISFADGTNTVSYTYQGDLWNQAIRDYYKGASFAQGVSPLYFGSNSWFTGNGRYKDSDRYGNRWNFTNDPISSEKTVTGGSQSDTGYIYNIPDDMSYINGNNYKSSSNNPPFDDPSNGISNSRAYPNLVTVNSNDKKQITSIKLSGNDLETPYFNKDFLLGKNDKNVVYGKVYENVDFEFKYNEETEYYEYDSTKSDFATRLTWNKDTGTYYMDYTGKGVTKGDDTSQTGFQFYPFNSQAANKDFYRENLMFGMKLNIPFVTYADSGKRTGIFKFSGDDDVWVYIDNTLALDIGGTHTAVGGVIDMNTGLAVVGSTFADDSGQNKNAKEALITDEEKAAFAIATLDGVKNNLTNVTAQTAKFFDDEFIPNNGTTFSARINEKNRYEVTINGTVKYKSKDLTFDDKTFEFVLNNLESVLNNKSNTNKELEHHDLNIYYMERGLNSSNFKLTFKLANETQREVEKVWPDSQDVNHSGDSIKVELYRTRKVEDTSVSDTEYDFEDGNKGNWNGISNSGNTSVENGGYNNTGKALKVSNRAAEWDGVQFGIPLSYNHVDAWVRYTDPDKNISKDYKPLYEENFESGYVGWYARGDDKTQLGWNDKSGHTGNHSIFVENRTVTWHGINYPLDASEYKKGEKYSFSVYVTHYNDEQENAITEPVTYYLKLQYTDFNNEAQYKEIARGTVDTIGKWVHLQNPEYTIPAEAAKDLIVYIETNNPTNKFFIDDFVIATPGAKVETTNNGTVITNKAPSAFTMTIRYSDANGKSHWATPSIAEQQSPQADTWYNLAGNINIPDNIGEGENQVYLIIQTVGGGYVDFYVDEVKFKSETSTFKTDVERVGEVILNSEKHCDNDVYENGDPRPWYHKWDSLLETNDGNEYTYFIREVGVYHNKDGNEPSVKDKEYRASYYNAKGEEIEASIITKDGKNLRVYQITDAIGVSEIVNNPLIELNVEKDWVVGANFKKPEIQVDIYNDVPEKVGTVTLTDSTDSAKAWKAALSNLPKYRRTSDGKYEKIKYYGIETNPVSGFEVSYNPNEPNDQLISGKTLYAFDENKLSLKVCNIDPSMKVFNVKILKTSALDNNVKLDGVEFKLYEMPSNTPKETNSTNGNGELQFSGLEPGKTYKLVETRSAPGYKTDHTEIVFTVKEDNGALEIKSITPEPQSGDFLTGAEIKRDSSGTYILELNIENQPYTITMPGTGGGGIVYLYAGALGMMLMSMILLALAERRREQ